MTDSTVSYDNTYQAEMTSAKGKQLGYFNLVLESKNPNPVFNAAETRAIEVRMDNFDSTIENLNKRCASLRVQTAPKTGAIMIMSDKGALLAFVNNCKNADKLASKLAKGTVVFTRSISESNPAPEATPELPF